VHNNVCRSSVNWMLFLNAPEINLPVIYFYSFVHNNVCTASANWMLVRNAPEVNLPVIYIYSFVHNNVCRSSAAVEVHSFNSQPVEVSACHSNLNVRARNFWRTVLNPLAELRVYCCVLWTDVPPRFQVDAGQCHRVWYWKWDLSSLVFMIISDLGVISLSKSLLSEQFHDYFYLFLLPNTHFCY
jgi:hypothetical protein